MRPDIEGILVTRTEEGLVATPGLLSRYVRLPGGARAHYMTAGETGPAVVLLHGGIAGSSGLAGWRFMAPFLGANGFRVYCPDMPTFGHTEDPGNFYGYGQGGHVDFLHDFITALCLDNVHLGGNSMGCNDAVQYLLAHPERVRSFALVAGPIGDLVPMARFREVDTRTPDEVPRRYLFDGTPESMRTMLEAIVYDPSTVSEEIVEMRREAANRHAHSYGPAMALWQGPNTGTASTDELVRLRTAGRLDVLTIPGIYLFGQEDRLYPIEGGHLQEDALPNVQVFYPEKTGHQGQTDRPELFNRVFLEFFRDGRVSWDTAVEAGVSRRRPVNPALVAVPQ